MSFLLTIESLCSALPAPPNGIKFGFPENATVYNDTVCQFSCNDGYIGSGSKERKCQRNATWSGEDFTCQSMYCNTIQYERKKLFTMIE